MQLEQLGTVALASLVTALAASRPAAACGGTPLEVVMALPRPSAVGVPLNAALITSSNMTLAQIWLRRVDGAPPGFESDAAPPATPADAGLGGEDVELEVECDRGAYDDGAVCIARPTELLEPNTRYAWRAALLYRDGSAEDGAPPLEWQEFTTGDAVDAEPIAAGDVAITVTEDTRVNDNPCGTNRYTRLFYETSKLREHAVTYFAGVTPSYVMHATVLEPGQPAKEQVLYSAPDCVSPVVYDAAGNVTSLPELCLLAMDGSDLVGDVVEDAVGEAATGEMTRSRDVTLTPAQSATSTGCAMSTGGGVSRWMAASLLLLGLMRRRARR